jgi:hypothetical protein
VKDPKNLQGICGGTYRTEKFPTKIQSLKCSDSHNRENGLCGINLWVAKPDGFKSDALAVDVQQFPDKTVPKT